MSAKFTILAVKDILLHLESVGGREVDFNLQVLRVHLQAKKHEPEWTGPEAGGGGACSILKEQ